MQVKLMRLWPVGGLILMLIGETVAGLPVKEWDKRFGGAGYDSAGAICPAHSGGYIVAGTSESGVDGDKTQASQGGSDYWLVKVNSSGLKEWDKRFGGSGDDYCLAVQQTADGGYILAGDSESGAGGDKTEPTRGGADYWIVKMDSAGAKEWDKRFGGSGDDFGFGEIQATQDGGYILCGESRSGAGGDKTEAAWGLGDYWVVKMSSAGAKEWDKRFGGAGYEECGTICQTRDGGYVVAGCSSSGITGDKSETSRGDYDYWVVKMSSAGVKEWDKRFGGAAYDAGGVIQQTSDGGYILAGYSESGADGDKTEPSRGGADYWIVKMSSAGAKEWDKRFGGSGNDYSAGLQATRDGAFVLAVDSCSGADGDKSEETRGDADYWVVKLLAPPVITGQPQSRTNLVGTAADFAVTAQNTAPLFYQWQKDSANVFAATSATHGIAAVTLADAGEYRCVISNAAGVSTSAVATLTVSQALPPSGVSASDGAYTNKVRVTWNAVPGAAAYEIWRNTSNDSETARQLAGGVAGVSYDDMTSAAQTTYYYWVKSVDAGIVSACSEPDTGYPGVVGPLVSVNGMVGDNIRLRAADAITIAVEMMNLPAEYLGINVDWWFAAYAHSGNLWYYLNRDMNFIPFDGNLSNCRPAYQGPLMNLPRLEVARDLYLAPGTYNIWFAVDYPMDGILRLDGPIMVSQVTIVVE